MSIIQSDFDRICQEVLDEAIKESPELADEFHSPQELAIEVALEMDSLQVVK